MPKRSVHGKFHRAYQVLHELDRDNLVVGVSQHYVSAIAAAFGWRGEEAAKFRQYCRDRGWDVMEVS